MKMYTVDQIRKFLKAQDNLKEAISNLDKIAEYVIDRRVPVLSAAELKDGFDFEAHQGGRIFYDGCLYVVRDDITDRIREYGCDYLWNAMHDGPNGAITHHIIEKVDVLKAARHITSEEELRTYSLSIKHFQHKLFLYQGVLYQVTAHVMSDVSSGDLETLIANRAVTRLGTVRF